MNDEMWPISGRWCNVRLPAYVSSGSANFGGPPWFEAEPAPEPAPTPAFDPQPHLGPAYIKVSVAEADEFVAWLRAAHAETCGSAREAYRRVAEKLGLGPVLDVR